MTLLDFIHILSRRKGVIIITAFFTLLAFALAVFNTPPQYTAKSSVRVLTSRSGSADYIEYNVDYSARVMNTYKELATSTPIITELGRYVSPVPTLDVAIVPDSELIEISATDKDPALAQFAANKLAAIIVDQSKLVTSSNEPPVTAYIAEPAILPVKPSSANPILLIGLGLAVGLIGGLALAFVFESLDTRLYTIKQMEAETKLSTIGNIPDLNGKNGNNQLLIYDSQVGAESFRRLTANISSIIRDKGINSFLVTSTVPRDGRSVIVANLAVTMAQTKKKVLVIDADMRNPKMHEIFGMTNTFGLTRLLTLKEDSSKSIFTTGYPGVDLLPAGPRPANPIEILDTLDMQELIHSLEKHYDVIFLDTPPCLTVTDAVVAASKVGGVLFVIREAWVRREALQNTLIQLRNANANLVGTVVNRTKLGKRLKNIKAPIQPEKNGSAPRGREKDLRTPNIRERLPDEPITKERKEGAPVPQPVDRQVKPMGEPALREKDLRIPRPPRETVVPDHIISREQDYFTQEAAPKRVTSEPVLRKPDLIARGGIGEGGLSESGLRDNAMSGHDLRTQKLCEREMPRRNLQERVVRQPDMKERVVRHPEIRASDISAREINKGDIRDLGLRERGLRQRGVVREPDQRQPDQGIPRERDLDYERYILERDRRMRDLRDHDVREPDRHMIDRSKEDLREQYLSQREQRDQDLGARDQSYRNNLDRDPRYKGHHDKEKRYSGLDDLNFNGFDEDLKTSHDTPTR